MVIDEENPTTATPTETQSAPQSTSSLVPPTAREAPLTTFALPREPTTWPIKPFSTFYFL